MQSFSGLMRENIVHSRAPHLPFQSVLCRSNKLGSLSPARGIGCRERSNSCSHQDTQHYVRVYRGRPHLQGFGSDQVLSLCRRRGDNRYGEKYEMDDETFEQVIALVGRHGSTDHC